MRNKDFNPGNGPAYDSAMSIAKARECIARSPTPLYRPRAAPYNLAEHWVKPSATNLPADNADVPVGKARKIKP